MTVWRLEQVLRSDRRPAPRTRPQDR